MVGEADRLAEWQFAGRKHCEAIMNFVCTDPAKPYKNQSTGWQLFHPRPWEYDAQQVIRSLGKKVAQHGPRSILVGLDSEGLAGVSCWIELDGPGQVHLEVAGIAPRHRRHAGVFAREMARETLSRAETAAIEGGESEFYVEAEIYNANDASQQLAGDMGLQFFEEHVTGAQTWNLRVDLLTEDPLDWPG